MTREAIFAGSDPVQVTVRCYSNSAGNGIGVQIEMLDVLKTRLLQGGPKSPALRAAFRLQAAMSGGHTAARAYAGYL